MTFYDERKAASFRARADYWPGRSVDLTEPRADDIDFAMIAKRLSGLPRFCNGTVSPYSVAEHSLFVCDQVSRGAKPYALLHDAHEAFFGDITSPAIKALEYFMGYDPESMTPNPLRLARAKLALIWDRVIYACAGLPEPTEAILDEIDEADARCTSAELDVIVHGGRNVMFGVRNVCRQPDNVEADFMNALAIYCPDTEGIVRQWRTLNPKY